MKRRIDPPIRKRAPRPPEHPIRHNCCLKCGALNPTMPKEPAPEKCAICGTVIKATIWAAVESKDWK
jgi:hypothetical protein